jgi:hypothetical protein
MGQNRITRKDFKESGVVANILIDVESFGEILALAWIDIGRHSNL